MNSERKCVKRFSRTSKSEMETTIRNSSVIEKAHFMFEQIYLMSDFNIFKKFHIIKYSHKIK